MREILFRGKRTKNGEWVYGWLGHMQCYDPHTKKISRIYFTEIDDDFYSRLNTIVDYQTVGQYTGLTDKNGKKIFEGDIVNVNTNKDTLCHRYEGRNLVIRFDEYHRFVASGRLEYPLCNHYEWEVIGNIHDNPELLKGGGE